LQPVPVGVHGELYIGGDGLARGYLNRSELTAERFVPNPFGDRPDLLLYWTGDLARYRPGGNIEFLGRIDSQVKIRGHRIELGEIESVLNQHPAMKETVIVFREVDSSGDKDLVLYFVPRQDSRPSVMDLREFLRRKVPEYMVPVIFISIDALPLSPNGKVDRSKLPLPDDSRPSLEETFVEPRTEIEELVAQVWLEVLKLEKIGIYDNFFDVGGHSLLATRVVARLRNNFSIDMPLRTLFELPTVAGLAGAVETALRVGQKINRPPILRVPRGAKILPSIAQELLLLLDELVPSNHLFNIPRAYRLTGPLDLLALGRSLNAVVARHEAFRTSFPTVDGEWIQFIAPSMTLNLNVTDLQRFPQSQREPEMRALAREEKTQSFDLVNGPLLRVKLFQTGPEQHVLLTTFHHIITDGWSINVFFQDLAAFYEAFSRDRQPFLAELPIQFADFSSWQRQALADDWMLNQLAYWEEQLKSPLTVLELVTNRRRSSELSFLTARTPVS